MRTKPKTGCAPRTLKIVQQPIGDLIEDPRNARKHSQKQIAKLAAGIGEFGFTNPILIDENKLIIAGHARRKAALLAGMSHVPTICIDGLSEGARKALAIADNKIGDMSDFDIDILTETLAELEAIDFNLELTGFDTAEIDVLFEVTSAPKLDPADTIPAMETTAVSRTGDLWLLGSHRLLCGNALADAAYSRLLGSEQADIVFADPPYNVPIQGHVSGLGKARHAEFAMASGEMSKADFTAYLTASLSLAARSSRDGSIHYICMDFRHMGELLAAGEAVYDELKNLCVWNKQSAGMGSLYRSQHELVFVWKKGKAPHVNNVELGRNGRHRTNIWSYPGLAGFGRGRDEALESHPTVKPVGLVADALRDCSRRGDLVVDPFSGSGTTIMAAERTRRRAAVIEIDPLYVDVAVRRWQAATGHEAVLADDGRTFAEIKAERDAASDAAPEGEA